MSKSCVAIWQWVLECFGTGLLPHAQDQLPDMSCGFVWDLFAWKLPQAEVSAIRTTPYFEILAFYLYGYFKCKPANHNGMAFGELLFEGGWDQILNYKSRNFIHLLSIVVNIAQFAAKSCLSIRMQEKKRDQEMKPLTQRQKKDVQTFWRRHFFWMSLTVFNMAALCFIVFAVSATFCSFKQQIIGSFQSIKWVLCHTVCDLYTVLVCCLEGLEKIVEVRPSA